MMGVMEGREVTGGTLDDVNYGKEGGNRRGMGWREVIG